ncbi:hypothetical protein GCM10022276_14150 [Sphingomonas limnosediminicola]|uniref:Antitoxin Xre/MbcA/ParS-like toxin-binding domain-containing protein n=1 Tax=Sphingomonas limnosediminicola TaxID=940133 RepID=A0ABP7LB88_9SPHN
MPHLEERRTEMYRLAAKVLGSAENAEDWMRHPALGLNGQVPAELIGTAEGVELVETLLMQIEYGVYV